VDAHTADAVGGDDRTLLVVAAGSAGKWRRDE